MTETCAICGCLTNRSGDYGTETVWGRSHASDHHYVAERFFGRSKNRPKKKRVPLFDTCPWGIEGESENFCYECHELLLHNPVLLPDDISNFAELVRLRQLSEEAKTESRELISGRIQLFNEIISRGIHELLLEEGHRPS